MSRNQCLLLAVLGLSVVLVYCAIAGLLMLPMGRSPAVISLPQQSSEGPAEAPTDTPTPSGTATPSARLTEAHVRMDEWQIYLIDVFVTPAADPDRKNLYLIVDVSNLAETNSTFSGFTMLLSDAEGRTYGENMAESWRCEDMYGLESAAFLDPGVTARTCVSYSVRLDAHSFTAAPFEAVSIWQGGLAFEVP